MKRYILSSFALIIAGAAFSQTVFEAVKTSQNDIIGTARYMSVAGAFGALGGDVSAIKDNPAGLGIFRKSELTATVDAQMQSADALWNAKKATDSKYSVGMNNLTLVLAGKTWRAESGYAGLLNSNFSFSYNKLRNFNRNITVKSNISSQSMTDYFGYFTGLTPEGNLEWDNYPTGGLSTPYANTNLSWMSVMADYGRLITPIYDGNNNLQEWTSFLGLGETVTPTYQLRESGGINEYSFAWSGNFSNRLFLGASLNLQSINHTSVSIYNEAFSGNGSMSLKNTLSTSGSGANLNIGLIAVPVDFIRLGLSLHTPMFYNMEQLNYASLDFDSSVSGNTETPTDNYVQYQFQTPLQFNVSTAFILDKRGFLSAEYVMTNYKGMKFIPIDEYSDYSYENEDITGMLQNARTIKVGGEYRLTDNFSLRAGFANTSNITNSTIAKILDTKTARTDPEYFSHNSTNYATFGLGYRESNWYFDFAYINKVIDEDYFAYNTNALNEAYKISPANVKTTTNNIVATFGIKF